MSPRAEDLQKINLPVRPFMFTLDQIADMLALSINALRAEYIFFDGRTIGVKHKDQMMARDIAPPDRVPEWRVLESELVRWLRVKGYRLHERQWMT